MKENGPQGRGYNDRSRVFRQGDEDQIVGRANEFAITITITSMSTSGKRSWNWSLWIGFVCALAGFLSYPLFVVWPATRDFPWANFLLFAIGGVLLLVGVVRAFGKPQVYRGKIFGTIFAVLSVLVFALFAYLVFYELRQVPLSNGAPRVGQKAPEFTLPDQDDKPVALTALLSGSKGAVLIFYRGFW